MLKTIKMLDTVEDTNQHIALDSEGRPSRVGGSIVMESRTDRFAKDQVVTIEDWQADALIGHGHAEAV